MKQPPALSALTLASPKGSLGALPQDLRAIGCLLGPVYGVYTTMGILIGQKGFAGAVSGGYGNMYGAIIGGMFFGFAETFISAYISTSYKDCISFGILIIILTFMPTGILKSKVLE